MDRRRYPRVELIHHGWRKPRREPRCKFSDEVTLQRERENRFQIKGKYVGVKGQRVQWEGITGLRLLHVSPAGTLG